MVKLNFNAYGHDFERGLTILSGSPTTALYALALQRTKIDAEYTQCRLGGGQGHGPAERLENRERRDAYSMPHARRRRLNRS